MRLTVTVVRGLVSILVLGALGCTTGGMPPMLVDAEIPEDAPEIDAPSDGGDGTDAPVERCVTPGSTVGLACDTPGVCDDGCFCDGVEQCVEGSCRAGTAPCVEDDIECTLVECSEAGDQCTVNGRNEMCGDPDMCNGIETCDTHLGCRPASALYCNDETSCTVDSCDPAVGCVFTPRDLDRDGFTDGRCGGEDCDDDPRYGTMIHPGAMEVCTNRRDDNCDGLRDYADLSCLPTNDACASAQTVTGSGTFSGSTRSLVGDYTLGCGPTTGPDAVFKFTLTEPHDVRVTISAAGLGSTAVALRSLAECATGPSLRCNAGTPPTILQRSLPAGDYAILVKTSTAGAFDLTMMITDPTPIPPVDLCDASTEDVSAGGTFIGNFIEVEDQYAVSCHTGGTGFKDAAYKFTITSPKDVTLVATTTASSFMPTTYVSLVRDCATPSTTIQCASGSSAMVRRRGLEPGTYYVLIESSQPDASAWTLNVTITDPIPRVPGDACTTALNITDMTQSVALSGVEFDVGTACGGSSTSYRDAIFYFTLTALSDVTLTTNTGGFHYVAVSTACGTTGSEIRCRSGSGSYVQSFRSLAAGTYYVVVATTASTGSVTASAAVGPPTPIPPNDRCSGAINISTGYSHTDTLTGFEDDARGCTGTGYLDAFYTLNLTARKNVSIIASRPGGGTSPIYLTLRATSCTDPTNLACSSGATPAIDRILDPGLYYLIVEMPVSSAGDFNLRAFVTDP